MHYAKSFFRKSSRRLGLAFACLVYLAVSCRKANKRVLSKTTLRKLFKQKEGVLRSDVHEFCSNALGHQVHKPKNCTLRDLKTNILGQPVHIFAHVTASKQLASILLDILFDLHGSGLMTIAESINVCVSGKSLDGIDDMLSGFVSERVENRIRIHHVSTNPRMFELPTINKLLEFARATVDSGSNAHILYVHSKGLFSESGAFVQKWYWRKIMQYWLIHHHEHCRKMLDLGYDTVGLNPITGDSKKKSKARVDGNNVHYSGNFWWASARHVARLKPKLHIHEQLKPVERFQAENLILSKYPNMCAGVVYSWGSTHMYKSKDVPSQSRMHDLSPRCDML